MHGLGAVLQQCFSDVSRISIVQHSARTVPFSTNLSFENMQYPKQPCGARKTPSSPLELSELVCEMPRSPVDLSPLMQRADFDHKLRARPQNSKLTRRILSPPSKFRVRPQNSKLVCKTFSSFASLQVCA